MAVDVLVAMPEQPTIPITGSVRYEALGGDGLRSPSQMASCRINSTGNATGGNHILRLDMDPSYMWLISWMRINVVAPAGDYDTGIYMIPTGDHNGVNFSWSGTNVALRQGMTVVPPAIPMLRPSDAPSADLPQVYGYKSNANGENVSFHVQLFGFHLEAVRKTPWELLAACLPSSGTRNVG